MKMTQTSAGFYVKKMLTCFVGYSSTFIMLFFLKSTILQGKQEWTILELLRQSAEKKMYDSQIEVPHIISDVSCSVWNKGALIQ